MSDTELVDIEPARMDPFELSQYFHEPPSTNLYKPLPGKKSVKDFVLHLGRPETKPQTAALERNRAAFERKSPARFLRPSSAELELMVYDLDTALFNGALKGNMRLTWEGTYNYRIVDHNPNATVDYKYQPQCIASRPTYQKTGFEILLRPAPTRVRIPSPPFRAGGSKQEAWGEVIHELLHAYLDLKTQPHGDNLEEACEAIVYKLALHGLRLHHVSFGPDLEQ
jgi:hypothetical protein